MCSCEPYGYVSTVQGVECGSVVSIIPRPFCGVSSSITWIVIPSVMAMSLAKVDVALTVAPSLISRS